MQTQLQLGRYIHVCINETQSPANVQDLIPTLAGIIISSTIQPKWGLNLVDLLEMVFHLYIYMDAPTQLELCLHDQLDS